MLNIVCRHPIKMSLVCLLDGVTGRQPTVVAAVAVPQSDEVRKGVGLGLLQHHRGKTLIRPHQVAAPRRPRTEGRPRTPPQIPRAVSSLLSRAVGWSIPLSLD